jgi:uncharacterized cofD-like protein
VVVSIAYDQGQDAGAEAPPAGRSMEDLRRSLESLSGEEGALVRAIRRPLTIERLGKQPLGNLVIASVASAFGDYGTASRWLGEQLGITGAVLPATTQPVPREVKMVEESPGTSGRGSGERAKQLSFASEQIEAPAAAVEAIDEADWVLLAPGSLYRSLLSAAAVPDLTAALTRTRARVLWIANLEPGSCETAGTSGADHLRALRRHGVRADVVLHDPSATLKFDSSALEACGIVSVTRSLRSRADSALHDPVKLGAILDKMIASSAKDAVRG